MVTHLNNIHGNGVKCVGSIVTARGCDGCPFDTNVHPYISLWWWVQQPPLRLGISMRSVGDFGKVKGEHGAAWVLSPARFFGTTQFDST